MKFIAFVGKFPNLLQVLTCHFAVVSFSRVILWILLLVVLCIIVCQLVQFVAVLNKFNKELKFLSSVWIECLHTYKLKKIEESSSMEIEVILNLTSDLNLKLILWQESLFV